MAYLGLLRDAANSEKEKTTVFRSGYPPGAHVRAVLVVVLPVAGCGCCPGRLACVGAVAPRTLRCQSCPCRHAPVSIGVPICALRLVAFFVLRVMQLLLLRCMVELPFLGVDSVACPFAPLLPLFSLF